MDKVVGISHFASFIKFSLCNLIGVKTIANILLDRTRFKNWFLRDNSDVFFKPSWIVVLDIDSIKENLTFLRTVESLYQSDKTRLATP
jgi:hypothetical protein